MKYSVLGAICLVLASYLSVSAQSGKNTKPATNKTATRKKTLTVAEPPVSESTIIVPNWLPPANPVQPAATIVTDLLHTRLDLRFDWAKQYVYGTAVLTVRPHFYPQKQLVLDAKGFEIKNIRLLSNGKEKALTYSYDKRKLVVNLDRQYTRTEPYQVSINYIANPNALAAGGSEAIRSDKGLYFINPLGTDKKKPKQLWTQGETEANSAWFPTIDKPNQRMTQEISLTVDGAFKTLSNGLLISSKKNADGTRTDVWKQSVPAAPYLTMIAVGDFAVVNDTWRGKAVDYYVQPKFQNTAKAVFGNTPAMMDFFSKRLGIDFPWEKYAQIAVYDFVSGAMENASAVTFRQEDTQLTRRELLDRNADDVIAHELFHHWFGDYVTCESWSNLALNESFADYSEFLWSEYKYGADQAALIQQQKLDIYLQEAQSKREPIIRYQYANREDMLDGHSYQKGGRVLHMLRKYVGDDAFFLALNRYLNEHKLGTAEIADLRLAFEEVTGEDLMWFFDQWFMKRGHPELKVTHSYNNGQVSLKVEQRQDSTFTPIYRLPVTVTTWVNNQPTDHRIVVSKMVQTFQLPVSQRPSLVKFDAEGQLLAQIEEERTQEELLYQYYHARNYLQKYEAIEQLRNKKDDLTVSAMLRNALNDPFWAVRQASLESLRKYKGAEGNAVRKEIQRVAASDPKSQVRAAALAVLSSFPNEDFGATYLAALNDSSYLVVGSAIEALAKAPNVAARDRIATLQETPSASLLTALSSYYASNGSIDQYQWYLRRLDDVNEEDLYAYLQNFGTFMQRMPVIEREKGVKRLETYARTHPQYYVRLGAYRALSSLVQSSPNLKAVLDDIRNKEKDERLKTFYSLM
ncbi:HEAT repeat domain-containing protein [Hymenobacter sp. BT175]|uniref:M1 family aminopeptidase n=1 Tax=Hymenobacter translucens TaxID=2886507 RepID=UPI001D0F1F73|nr:M1 family aminopeptidase [Hymenobacter translucens]MCC2548303.1 HEAT repeat domain-containing protein [Hymenobacter translucens]